VGPRSRGSSSASPLPASGPLALAVLAERRRIETRSQSSALIPPQRGATGAASCLTATPLVAMRHEFIAQITAAVTYDGAARPLGVRSKEGAPRRDAGLGTEWMRALSGRILHLVAAAAGVLGTRRCCRAHRLRQRKPVAHWRR
jgi:hypothetical protein